MGSEQKITIPPLGGDLERIAEEFSAGLGKLKVYGLTVPVDGTEGYAPGCFFIKVDGGDGDTFFVNEGTLASSDFNLVTLA